MHVDLFGVMCKCLCIDIAQYVYSKTNMNCTVYLVCKGVNLYIYIHININIVKYFRTFNWNNYMFMFKLRFTCLLSKD